MHNNDNGPRQESITVSQSLEHDNQNIKASLRLHARDFKIEATRPWIDFLDYLLYLLTT